MKKLTEIDIKHWKHVTKSITPLGQSSSEPKSFSDIINFPLAVESYKPNPIKKSNQSYEAVIDLHGMTQTEAHVHLARLLAQYKIRSYRCILVITGKGGKYGRRQTGVLKRTVPLWMETAKFRHLVRSTSPAKREHGGDGALYIFLK